MKNLNEYYPLQYESNLGEVNSVSLGTNRSKGRILYHTDQEVNSLDSIEIFKTAVVATATDRRAVIEAPKQVEIQNSGDVGLGLVLKVPIWTDDVTQNGSNFLQMILGVGEKINLPTTQIIDSVDSGFNKGTVVSSFTTPSTNLYVDSTANVDSATADGVVGDATATLLYLEPYTDAGNCTANLFRIGDLIRIDSEIMEVTAIGTKADLANNTLTVKRGMFGSTATTGSADTEAVNFAFFNTTRKFNNYTSTCTNELGVFSSTNFFGLGRGLTLGASGIVPGSVCFKFYSEPYQEMGCTDLSSNSSSGLNSGETYYIKVAVNGGSIFEVPFVVDSVKLGGSSGVLRKIQDILDTQYNTAGSVLLNKRVSVSLVNGDVRWTFHERKVGSAIAITAGATGDTSHDLVANAVGVFPASVEPAVSPSLPNDTVFDSKTYQEKPNKTAFLYDDGMGSLVGGAGSGSINYETGALTIRSYKLADIVFTVSHTSGMAGRASSSKTNIIEEVFAISTNSKVNSSIKVTVRG